MGDKNLLSPATPCFGRQVVGAGYICRRLYPLQFQGGLTSGRQPVVKTIAESLSQDDEKYVVPTPHSGTRVGKRIKRSLQWVSCIL
jgi:hypothetical protein